MEREYRNMGRNRRRACCLVIILLLSGICGAVNDKKFGGDVILTGDEAMLWFYNGVYYIRFRASGSLAGNYDFVWPTDDGATGQQLTTNGSGVLSWVDPGGAGGAGDISDVWNVTNGNANALTAASGDSLDATNADSTIPWEVDTTAAPTEEGRSVWDSDNDILTIGDGIGTDYVAYGASDGDALSGDSATSFFDTGEIEAVHGGTGAATLTDGGVLLGSGTGAITPMAVLADGEFIVGDGTTDPVAESGDTARTSLGLGTTNSPTFAGAIFNGQVTIDRDSGNTFLRLQTSPSIYATITLTAGDLSFFATGGDIGFSNENLTTSGNITGDRLIGSSLTISEIDNDVSWVIEAAGVDQITVANTSFSPTTDNYVSLGDSNHEYKDLYVDGTANIDSLVADTADINAGTFDGTIGGTTPAAGTFTSLSLNDTNTQITEDGSGNMTFKDAVYGTKTLSEMGSPTMVKVTAATVAEGSGATLYHNMASFNDKVLITSIDIDTTSTDYTFKVCPDDDADGVGCITLLSNRSGDFVIYWMYNYEDTDASSEFHYFFESDSGSETHDIDVRGIRCL